MQPWRNSEWVRVLLVLDLSSRSMPRLSPTAPSRVSNAMANALTSSSRSRLVGSPTRVADSPMPKRRSFGVAEAGFDGPALGIVVDQHGGGRLRVAGGQAPGLLHAL